MTTEEQSMVHEAAGLFTTLPKLVQVILFIALGVTAAMAGTLDDWVRVVFAILFAGVAVSLAAEAKQSIDAHRAPQAPDPSDVSPRPPA